MSATKKRRGNKMSVDEFSDTSPPIDRDAALVTPRKSIHSYSTQSGDYSRSEGIVNVFFSFIIRLCVFYTLKPRLISRLLFYAALILTLGLIRDYVLLANILPKDVQTFIHSFKIAERSWFNMYTVKIGWFWTLVSIVPYMLFTRYELAKRDSQKNSENQKIHFFTRLIPCIIRVAIMTVIWYLSVEFFVFYADKSGTCLITPTNQTKSSDITIFDRKQCKKSGHTWLSGFDISGHIFLMIFSNFVRFEEFKYIIKYFEEFTEFRYMKYNRDRIQNYCSPYSFRFNMFHIRSLIYLIVFFLVTVVWDFMIIQTSLFYHSLSQKIIGFLWAIVSWFVVYRMLYPQINLKI